MGRRILNDALRAIVNAERRGKATVELQPISTVMSSFLNIMKYRAYFPGLSLHPDCIRKVVDEREFWTEQVACLHFINASIHVLDHAIYISEQLLWINLHVFGSHLLVLLTN